MFAKGSKVGGYASAAAAGAIEGIAKGDLKMVGKGALEGAVGHGLGIVATTALTPFLGPAAAFVGPMVGAIVAGPATKGILAGGKQMGAGLKNVWGGLKGGGFKQMGKGVLQMMGSGQKAALVATKAKSGNWMSQLPGMGRGGALSTGLKWMKGKGGWVLSAIMMFPTLMDAVESGNWAKMIPAILSFGGGILGAAGGGAVGALLGGVGALPLGIAGSMGGSAIGEALGNSIIGAKKGAMVNKPTLFMAGEEGLP